MYNVHEEEGVSMTIAVLAVQGAFAEHEKKLDELGISWFELRKKRRFRQTLRRTDPAGRREYGAG